MPTPLPSDSAIDRATRVLQSLPPDSTMGDILHELVIEKLIEEGTADCRDGRTLTHDEVRQQVKSWGR